MWAFAARRCSSAADAEDVVARTFQRLLERLERYQPGRGPVAACALAIARSLLLDDARLRARAQTQSGLEEAAVRQRLSRGLRALQQSLSTVSPEGLEAAARGEPV